MPSPAPEPLTVARLADISKLHFGYTSRDVSQAELAALPVSLPDHDPGELGTYWPQTGAQAAIGLVNTASARWAATLDPRAEANMVAVARAMRWVPYHVSAKEEPGAPIRFWKYPFKSMASSQRGDTGVVTDPQPNPQNIQPDMAHERHPLYLYALRCRLKGDEPGFAFAISEFKWLIGWQYVTLTDNGRGYSLYICNSLARQVRDAAWSFASILQFVAVCPPDDEWFKPCMDVVRNNIDFYVGMFIDGDYDTQKPVSFAPYYDQVFGARKNAVGLMCGNNGDYGGDGTKVITIPGFQQAFLCTTILFGQRLDLPLNAAYQAKFKRWALFAAGWVVRLFGAANDRSSYDYRRAGLYGGKVGENGKLFTTDAELLAFNGGPLGPDDRNLRNHDSNDVLSGLAFSFFDNVAPALSFAVDLQAPGAAEGFARFRNARQWSAGSAWPFAMTPKGAYFHEQTTAKASAGPAARTPILAVAYPGRDVDPMHWVVAEGAVGRVPFVNTIRQALPDALKPDADSWTRPRGHAAYFADRQEIARSNTGAVAARARATIYSNWRLLRHEARNWSLNALAEAPIAASHDLARPASWGFGSNLLMTWMRQGTTTPSRHDPDALVEDGSLFGASLAPRSTLVFDAACECHFLMGWFFGAAAPATPDEPTSGNTLVFVSGDVEAPSDVSWPDLLGRGAHSVLTVDEDQRLLVAIQSDARDDCAVAPTLRCRVMDLDAARSTHRTVVEFALRGLDGTIEPDRCGFAWLRGKGIVGLHTNVDETIGVQIRLGANPLVDPPRVTIPFAGLPALSAGAFGAFTSIHELGVTIGHTGPDDQPLQINWPSV